MEAYMKLLVAFALALFILLFVGTGLLRSRVPHTGGQGGSARMPQDQQSAVRTDKLPLQDFEDRSLVFPREIKP